MNKYIVICLISLTCLLTACSYTDYMNEMMQSASGTAVSGNGASWMEMLASSMTPAESPSSISATGTSVSGTGINSTDNVTLEMQNADYWINHTVGADKILMDESEITAFNTKMMTELSQNDKAGYYDLSDLSSKLISDEVKKWIESVDFTSEQYYDNNNNIVSEKKWNEYYANCQTNKIPSSISVQYGIVCNRADVRTLPTADFITNEQGSITHDSLQDTALAINEPVLVLHESKDKGWYYIIANEYRGWVQKETIGIFSKKDDWTKAQKMDSFVVITGDKVSTEVNPYDMSASTTELTMGTKVKLLSKSASSEKRTIYDNYLVSIPTRNQDGSVSFKEELLPLGSDVHLGNLEYTRANILRQAFKLLGNVYGWGGRLNSRDCSSLTRDIYLCFGIRLPRNSGAQGLVPSQGKIDLSKLLLTDKMTKLNGVQPGTILQMPGHVMIYLGCVDKKYYVISANGGFQSSDGKNDYITQAVTVNDLEVKSSSDGRSWMEKLTSIVAIP